ncbi:MAG: phage holin family protein [Acidobacteriota bacterium]|jgi:hypothetical protein|nr:phage holin family protein [Acidobacteriota bacterium]
MHLRDLLEVLIHAVLAVFGVSARELRYKDIRKLKAAKFISNAIISSFGATIVFLLASMTDLPPQMGYIMAGLVGWGGPQIIDKLFEKNVDIAKEMKQEKENAKAGKATDGNQEDGES